MASILHPPGNSAFKSPDAFKVSLPLRTNYLYGKIKKTLPELYAFTICLWLRSSALPGIGTPFSYAVPGQANEIVLIEWGNNPIELLINDKVSPAWTLPTPITAAVVRVWQCLTAGCGAAVLVVGTALHRLSPTLASWLGRGQGQAAVADRDPSWESRTGVVKGTELGSLWASLNCHRALGRSVRAVPQGHTD